jgi:hypothetical protein
MKKRYYKVIGSKKLRAIQNEARQFLARNSELVEGAVSYTILDYESTRQQIPSLWLEDWPFEIVRPAMFVMHGHADGRPHRDQTLEEFRLNIPVLNCEGTWTAFWELREGCRDNITAESVGNEPSYLGPYRYGDLRLADRVELVDATLIRPREIHSIMANQRALPRISLTLEIQPWPEDLFYS